MTRGIDQLSQSATPAPQMHFIDKCFKQMILPRPTFAKVDGRTLSLHNTWLSEQMAEALQTYFQHTNEDIRIVFLANNGLSDSSLAKVLNGLKGRQIEKLVIVGNEVGDKAMAELQTFFNSNLKSLELGEIKFIDRILEHSGLNLSYVNCLRCLTLKGINLSGRAAFSQLLYYF